MNRKSPSSRAVRMAAMSPARSRLGPLVVVSPTPISVASMRQRLVFPSPGGPAKRMWRSEEHTAELQSRQYLVCRLLIEKKHQHTLGLLTHSQTLRSEEQTLL